MTYKLLGWHWGRSRVQVPHCLEVNATKDSRHQHLALLRRTLNKYICSCFPGTLQLVLEAQYFFWSFCQNALVILPDFTIIYSAHKSQPSLRHLWLYSIYSICSISSHLKIPLLDIAALVVMSQAWNGLDMTRAFLLKLLLRLSPLGCTYRR